MGLQREIYILCVNSQHTMAAKPTIVVHSLKKRFRRDSGSSEGSDCSPSRGRKLFHLSEKIICENTKTEKVEFKVEALRD